MQIKYSDLPEAFHKLTINNDISSVHYISTSMTCLHYNRVTADRNIRRKQYGG